MKHMTIADETWASLAGVRGLAVDLAALRAFTRSRPGAVDAFGSCGATFRLYASSGVCNGSVIVTQGDWDGGEWIHASIARQAHMPSYDDLTTLKLGAFGPGRYAFQVFPPESQHVSIHNRALHLWGRADGTSPLPDFGVLGTI